MSDNLGNGVTRVLPADQTQWDQVIFQWDRPPLDSEWNLVQQLSNLKTRQALLAGSPSGWVGAPAQDSYETNGLWSNQFRLKGGIALVNGWLVPVTGTRTGQPPGQPNNIDDHNRIQLDPPPSSSGEVRADFVFLEVWKARVAPNPSGQNKPSSNAVYRFGNLEGGYDYLADDIQDPAIGEETSQRVQIQYRIRVVTGLTGLAAYPDGFDPAAVKGQGTSATPTSYTFANCAETLKDPGLWRAGDGTPNSLGTVDGYVYAIPLTICWRRNSVGWDGEPGQNLNGGVNRNPTAVDRTGAKTWTQQAVLAAPLTATAMTFSLVSATGIPLPTLPGSMYLQIRDEVISYSALTGTTGTILARGQLGTSAEAHPAGSQVMVMSDRPDGLFADQVARQDIMDIRHVVSPNGFNYRSLLQGSLDALLRGQLKTDWKRSGGGTAGTTVLYQDKVSTSAASMGVTKLDSPDNIRCVWSDAVVTQQVDCILTPANTSGGSAAATWDLQGVQATHVCSSATNWTAGDQITFPVASLAAGLTGADLDQVKWLTDSWAVKVRSDGSATALQYGVDYSVSVVTNNLRITLLGPFSTNNRKLFCQLSYQMGPGRGLSRRPDSVHAVHLLDTAPQGYILRTARNEPSGEIPLTVSWAPLWSRYRRAMWNGLLPSTAASYIDPGSKTAILTPWRQVRLPTNITPQDGSGLNGGAGLMPGGDPLQLFASAADTTASTKNIYVQIPRNLLPTWGEVKVPILRQDQSVFHEGVNFGILAQKGTSVGDSEKSYVQRKVVFSTAVTYNTASGLVGGIRKYTDTRGLGRKGLELPPFYGISRLFAVYEKTNYTAEGSGYDDSNLDVASGNATNLLRQDIQGATFWIEEGTNGDSTFILNAECLDLTKANLASFEAGDYVIECSIFGFDRGAFTSDNDPRIVLSKGRGQCISGTRGDNYGPAAALALNSPTLVTTAPPSNNESIGITYSRTPYQGDCLGTQLNHTDVGYQPGPLTSSMAYQLASTKLDYNTLTRPNQKVVEVLDSIGFVTTLGTGRLAGDTPDPNDPIYNLSRVGREDRSAYPPTSGAQARPALLTDAFTVSDSEFVIGNDYLGCTERLPLGALWRDKDFLGSQASQSNTLTYHGTMPAGTGLNGLATRQPNQETREEACHTATVGSGAPAQMLVHVDGNQGNYGLLNNYRTARGGSAFTAVGRPGGDLQASLGRSDQSNGGALSGVAYLVRVAPFSSGLTMLTHGSELMMLVSTTAQQLSASGQTHLSMQIGTSGSQEGNSAADLYRVPGRPLEHVRGGQQVDPNAIQLTRPT